MTTLSLRTPTDVLAAVPYLFGFHPTDSLVVLALHGRNLVVQLRADLPPPEHLDQVIRQLTAVTVRHGPTGSIIIGYGLGQPVCGSLRAIRAALEACGVAVLDVLRVHDGRYWRLDRDGPADGTPFDASTTEVAAQATFTGLAALPDRSALVSGLDPLPGDGLAAELAKAERRLVAECGVAAGCGAAGLARGQRSAAQRRRRAAARVATREALTRAESGERLDDPAAAWLAVLIADRFARDDAWQRMLAAPPLAEHADLWRDLLRRVERRYVPAPATLLALTAWRLGDGITALVAAERALAAEPGYALADLVIQALQAGIPPAALDEPPLSGARPTRVARTPSC